MAIYYWAEHLYDFLMLTVLIPLLLGLLRWQRLTGSVRWVIVFLGALFLHELLAHLCIKLHVRNHFLYYNQTLVVLCSVAGLYDDDIGRRHTPWWVAFVISASMVIEVVFWVGFNHINSVTLSISRLLPAIYAVICLNRLFKAKDVYSLMPNPKVYIHLGFFVFGAFTAITAYFKSYFIETSLDLYYLFNTMSAMMSAVAFGLFTIGFSRMKLVYTTQR